MNGAPSSMASSLRDYRGVHAGESIVVCGCGSSLKDFRPEPGSILIGVNDLGRLLDPDYLVVLNPRGQFSGDRFRYVEESRAKAIFSQLDLGISHPKQIRFRLGRRGGSEISEPDSLPYTTNSPYLAVCLAAYMGARRIGLIGVDFTDHHFFAPTGAHVLTRRLNAIDREYGALRASLAANGVELYNLSAESRLSTIPKLSFPDFFALRSTPRDCPKEAPVSVPARSMFVVGYEFRTCGSVFNDGLTQAAAELGLRCDSANWDDPKLAQKVAAFRPDLLFVVHGRKFSSRWPSLRQEYPSAVWLLDEPYEVDDASRYSSGFGAVFINDPSTVHRHQNAHYLPACFDPSQYSFSLGRDRTHDVGFVGGANAWREAALADLARKGLLSYVVGGPWRNARLNELCLARRIDAADTAKLYRDTRIVINLFRTEHHFNFQGIPAVSLNPRVYEALACGALVISEHRPELDSVFPEMPAFRSLNELESLVRRYIEDARLLTEARDACVRRLSGHTYADRLRRVLTVTNNHPEESSLIEAQPSSPAAAPEISFERERNANVSIEHAGPAGAALHIPTEWAADPECVFGGEDQNLVLSFPRPDRSGIERGLIGARCYRDAVLEFDLLADPDTRFIAKLRQEDARNQITNSYHLICAGSTAYIARHNCVLRKIRVPGGRWVKMRFSCIGDCIELWIDGVRSALVHDGALQSGYCFLGVKSGTATLRNIQVSEPAASVSNAPLDCDIIQRRNGAPTCVTIVTTVYDRVECLEQCIQSVAQLRFTDYEQIIVADKPSSDVLGKIEDLVSRHDADGKRITLASLKSRRNDWGMTPASAGVALATGKYISFLSDDNGYTPGHFDPLVATLEKDQSLGFVYSSCLYGGRQVLNSAVPRACRIDLGQPLFRRELFDLFTDRRLPFHEFGWDWRMIEHFVKSGVRWRHVNKATFIFRLAKYPHLMAPSPAGQPA